MEHWDPQMMLDLYIHNYLIRNNMHETAEIFAREANVCPKAVALDPPEGFLSEWWSLFWSVYSTHCTKHAEATEDSSSQATQNAESVSQNVNSVMLDPDVDYILQTLCPTVQMPGLPSMLQTFSPRPDIGNLQQGDASRTMPRPILELPISDFSIKPGQTTRSLITAPIFEQELLKLPVRDLNSDSQVLNVNQLACMLPSSRNSSHLLEKVYRNPQLSVTRNDKGGTSLRRSTAAEPTYHPPRPIEPKIGPAGRDSQGCLQLPVKNLNYNSELSDFDQLLCLLPSSSNCSYPKEMVYKKQPMLSVKRDDKCGASSWISTAANPTSHQPKATQLKMVPADTDASMREQELLRLYIRNLNSNSQLLDVHQLAHMLPSSSNCSHPQKRHQLSVTQDGGSGTELRSFIGAEPICHAQYTIQPKTGLVDADARMTEQERLKLPVRNLNSKSQLLGIDQLARLLSSSGNCSHPQKDVNKSHLSLTRDDGCGTSLRISTAAEPTRNEPKAIQHNVGTGNTGLPD
ncbi:UNVERIFIED_CONTAM: Transcriptional corepressor LEUNIG [Sesamum calycinum]|uniref:Transcriptional corepressor LEUNIG n=1 Tax=Sesamum calycinum TaxID=2727403 RepID=A0AAW2MD24_9LAMI